ncbi:MAG TPA: hypothetical protein VIH99_13540 [Bdellovibrionota bacterium]|jgi:hypothetical protein
MKQVIQALLLASVFFHAGEAFAFRASHFRGVYEVKSEHARDPEPKKYVIVDVNTVAVLWSLYGEGDLPEKLIPVKNEPAVLAGFNFRDGLFFTLEQNCMITDYFLGVKGGENNLFNLRKHDDGTNDSAVRVNGVTSFYDLGPRQER